MAISRRGFMAGIPAVGAVGLRPTWQDQESPPSHAQPKTVHCLGPKPENKHDKLVARLSEDIFDRICKAAPGPYRMAESGLDRLGSVTGRLVTLDTQAHTGICLSNAYCCNIPPEFDLERFRKVTDRWENGQGSGMRQWPSFPEDKWTRLEVPAGALDPTTYSAAEIFAGKTIMAMGKLPQGVTWASHYVDERTGCVMRVVSTYEITWDATAVRWDVLCG